MKKLIILFLTIVTYSCKPSEVKLQSEKQIITVFLNNWHKAAAEANFDAYFNAMAEESIYIGTDATENWTKNNFKRLQNLILTVEKHGVLKPSSAIFIVMKMAN